MNLEGCEWVSKLWDCSLQRYKNNSDKVGWKKLSGEYKTTIVLQKLNVGSDGSIAVIYHHTLSSDVTDLHMAAEEFENFTINILVRKFLVIV